LLTGDLLFSPIASVVVSDDGHFPQSDQLPISPLEELAGNAERNRRGALGEVPQLGPELQHRHELAAHNNKHQRGRTIDSILDEC
jgi:hypothetical protein